MIKAGASTLELINASCADQVADCIVNAANRNLLAGGGICGVIFRKAGMRELSEACSRYGTPLADGDAVITPAFGLTNAKAVIHAVGPNFAVTPEAFDALEAAYYNSFCVMMENDFHSISLPLISSGIFGGSLDNPAEVSARYCVRAFEKFAADHPEYRAEVKLCAFSATELEQAQRACRTMSRADRAEELFRMGYNCSQSVFAAFADLINMDVAEAAAVASPFGAGFGKLREVCGAVSGMTMLAGYSDGYGDPEDAEAKKELYKLIQTMCAEFERRQGSIICREMLGLQKGEDLAEPAVRTEEYYQSRPCVKACRDAAEIAEKYLSFKDKAHR